MWPCFTPFCCCCEISAPQAAAPVQLRGRALLLLLHHCCRSSTNPAVRDISLQLCSWWRHFMVYLSIPQANATEFLLFRKETLWFGCSSGRDCPRGHWAGIFLFSGAFLLPCSPRHPRASLRTVVSQWCPQKQEFITFSSL